MRFLLAVLVCRVLRLVGKLVGKGTAKPGDIARVICPNILRRLRFDGKILCVTGTNGKTTTANLITHILRKNGFSVINNSFGSNMLGGITTAFLCACDLKGRVKADYSVIEIDERWLRFLVKEIHPDYLLITNLLRDQIMRNCCPEIVLKKIELGIPEETVLILNADDPVSQQASWNRENKVIWFSLGATPRSTKTCISGTDDGKVCPKCLHRLSYDFYHYNHIGAFHCENCGFQNPAADFVGTDVDFEHGTMNVNGKPVRLSFDAIYYYYNTVAATAACCSLAGMETETVLKLAEGFDIGVTKRYEEREILGRPAKFILTKQNPASVDQSVLFIAQKPGPRTAIIIAGNMFHTENKDVLYMYDVAYENLAGVEYLIIVGERRYDMAVRLKLAGVDMKKVQICETEDDLPACLEKTKGDIYVMSPLHAQTNSKLLRS